MTRSTHTTLRTLERLARWTAAGMFAVSAGCGDGAGSAPNGETSRPVRADAGPSGHRSDGGADQATGPALYAVVSRVTLPSSGSTVIAVTDSLEPGELDTQDALEIPGFGAAHGTAELPGAFFVGSAEQPELTRYALAADGAFSRQDTLSLGAFGLAKAPRSVVFASATKAYAISPETYQLFAWNPQTMSVEREIDLGMLERDGFVPAWVFRAAIHDGKLFVPITWVRTEGDPSVAADSALVVVDVRTDDVTIVQEPRCGGLRAIFAAGSGDLYFSSTAGAPATWRRLYGEDGGSEACVLRMNSSRSAFDTEFLLRPSDLDVGAVAVDFSPAGPSHLIFQALDESIVPITAEVTAEELWSAAAWRFFSVPITALRDDPAPRAEPVDLPPSALNALRFEVDDRNFVPQIEADYSRTTIMDVTDPEHVVAGPTIIGSVGNLFRIR